MGAHKGAALLLPVLPNAQELIADKAIDTDLFRQALLDRKHLALHSSPKG